MSEEHPPAHETAHKQYGHRDAETQMVLGGFITFIAIPVLIGTFWAERPHAMVVNIIAGLVLLCIGVSLGLLGFRGYRSLKRKSEGS